MRCLLVCTILAFGCSAQTPPSFEVASVKPTQHGRVNGLSISYDPETPSPGRFRIINNSLSELIRWAYRVREYQLSGPPWLDDDSVSFDIEAKMPPDTPRPQLRLMLQTLLKERFRLAVHTETRTLPVYELWPVKSGPKVERPAPGARKGISYEGKFWSELKSENTTVAEFASILGSRLGHPVIDKTDITTPFAVHLVYRIADTDTEHPSLFAALQEKLGLSLKASKGPVEILVVDHIEKAPSEN